MILMMMCVTVCAVDVWVCVIRMVCFHANRASPVEVTLSSLLLFPVRE